MNVQDEYYGLLFDVRRSVRYHMRRRGFFESFHALVLFIGLLGGSATMVALGAELGSQWPLWLKLLPGALIAASAAADLVVGAMRKAWLHADLARRFIELERTIASARREPTEALIAEWTDRRLEIEAGEPRILRVLDTICYNEMLRAMEHQRRDQIPIGFWQRCFAHFFDFREHRLHAPPS